MTKKQRDAYYKQTEQEGRARFKALCDEEGWQVTFSTGKYDCFDAEIVDNTGPAIVEIKVRRDPHDAREGWMLEKDKLRRLLDEAYDDEGIIYVNFYEDGHVRLWAVDELLNELEEDQGTFNNLGTADQWHTKEKAYYDLTADQAYIDWEWGTTYDRK